MALFEEASDLETCKRLKAMDAVFGTVPTTLAGMRAKVDFALSGEHIQDVSPTVVSISLFGISSNPSTSRRA